jgi:general secretion pathway protein D
MKRFIVIVLLLVSFNSYAQYDVNFNNMSMKDFVKFTAEFTGKNFVYDENDLRGQVTVQTGMKMNSKDVMDIFYATLELNGLTAVDKQRYIQIVKSGDVKFYGDNYINNMTGKENGFLTTVVSPKNFNVRMLVSVLKNLSSRSGNADILVGMNAIVIRDSADRIQKIMSILDTLEREAAGYTVKSIVIKNGLASNVEKIVSKLYAELQKNFMTAADPVIVADDYSNVLVIAAKEGDFERINYIINQVDSSASSAHSQPKVFYLNNANAEDVEKVMNKLLSSVTDPKTQAVVKSQVAADKATNSIIVVGDQELYQKVEGLIEKLDIPRRQVYVEALIIETTLDSGNKFGVEWQTALGGKNGVGTVGFINDNGGLNSFQGAVLGDNSIPSMAGGFNLGILGDIIKYDGVSFPSLSLLVNAIKSASGVNILSNPQILTLDNEEAEIFAGENRPFLTSTKYDSNNNPVQSYDYRDVGVKLKIQPQISANDYVTLSIEQEVKKVSSATFDSTQPVTLTRNTKTKVKLKDGSMVVISGLMKDDSSEDRSAVPGLSKIPLIGWLFKNTSKSYEKTNLMVFINAQIISSHEEAEELSERKRQESVDFKNESKKTIDKSFK